MTINAFFNARHEGDNYKGLNATINGITSDRTIRSLPEFLTTAGRDYDIQVVPAFQRLPGGDFAAVEDQFHLVRSVDQRVVSPKTVSAQYDPLSLKDAASEVQSFVDAGWATPDGVYDARGGSLEVLSLRLDADGQIGPDEFLHYIVVVIPHGGGKAQGKIISWRIVCCNTFAAAVSASYDFAIGHRKGRTAEVGTVTKERFSLEVQAWQNVQDHIRTLADKINVWNGVSLKSRDAEELTDKLLGIKKLDDASTQKRNNRDAILAAFNNGQIGTYGRTAWDWLNGVTYFTSNGREGSKVSAVDRMVRNIEPTGTGFKLEQSAERLLAELVA
jgi:hypothetical protein